MSLSGLWGLLGIPAVILIHFIQPRLRRREIATLFLLDRKDSVRVETRTISRIRNSLSFWLQILTVVVLTFLLCEPQRTMLRPVQRVALVLDSSFSMAAAKERMLMSLPSFLDKVESSARVTEWFVYETNLRRGQVYHGFQRRELFQKLAHWEPSVGEHDIRSSLRAVADVIGEGASYYLLTDHRFEVLDRFSVLSFGRELPNWGVLGTRVSTLASGALGFETVVGNYSREKSERTVSIEIEGKAIEQNPIVLDPGKFTTVHGEFPKDVDEVVVRLNADEFQLDDALPIRRPKAKELKVFAERGEFSVAFRRILTSLDSVQRVEKATQADLRLQTASRRDSVSAEGAAIVFFEPKSESVGENGGPRISGPLIAEHSLLSDGLNWGSFFPGSIGRLKSLVSDEVVIWAGQTPLIFMRETGVGRQLFVNFDIRQGNTLRDPAMILMLNRFVEQVRSAAPGYLAANLELNQPLPGLTGDLTRLRSRFRPVNGVPNEGFQPVGALPAAPLRPGFIDIADGAGALFSGAAAFADARESDFSGFESFVQLVQSSSSSVRIGNAFELWYPLFIMLLISILLTLWTREKWLRALCASALEFISRRGAADR